MASWWNSTGATNLTRGITSLTGQLSNNLKDILSEASEETFDPAAELTRAREQIDDLEFRKQALAEECTSLKKQCDELIMQKQAVEIKSDMLLAESRRVVDEKDAELKRLRENASQASWNSTKDLNNTWTDILEDDQPEISEYLKYQKMIRDLKDENTHLRDEMVNVRKAAKAQLPDKNQYRREEDVIQMEQMYSEQITQYRREYDEKIHQLQSRIKELEDWNEAHQDDELRKSMEVQKEVDDVDKDLLSHELEQAISKLNWYNEKFKDYTELQSNIDALTIRNRQTEQELARAQAQQAQNEAVLLRVDQYEETIARLQEEIDQVQSKRNQEERAEDNDQNRLLVEERQRCDALATDNDAMCQLLEQTRTQTLQMQTQFEEEIRRLKQTVQEKDHLQEEIRSQHEQIAQLTAQIHQLQNQEKHWRTQDNQRELLEQQITKLTEEKNSVLTRVNHLQEEVRGKDQLIEQQKGELQSFEQEIHRLNDEKTSLISQANELRSLKDEQSAEKMQEDENHEKEFHLREMLERQLIEVNEDLQALENDKSELHQQIDELKEQVRSKDRQIQSFENSALLSGSPSTMSSSPNNRARSPSPQTFEHLLELEAQILRHEQDNRDLQTVYDRFATLLPIELSSRDNNQSSLADQFVHLFEQWTTYVDTLSITQQELESLKQLLIEKQDDLEKLQVDLDLTTSKLIELQQKESTLNKDRSLTSDPEEDEDEIERILDLHSFQQRAPSRQSLISSTPGEKQQLIAQNELLSSLLAEKDRELISSQQADKSRDDLTKTLEALKITLQQMELDKEVKQVEVNEMRNVLDEKLRENSSLKKEKMYFIEKLSEMERDRQEQPSMIQIVPKQSIQEDEKSSTASSPSRRNSEEQSTDKLSRDEEYEKLRGEYDQLVVFSKRQHDESLSYYNEYTRILSLYNDLNAKHSQLQIDYESLQSLIQQKNEAYLQCQNELNQHQNLLYHEKKKAEDADLLRAALSEREAKCQQLIDHETELLVKLSELEREKILLEQNNFELRSSEQALVEQLQQTNPEQLHLELKRGTHQRDLAIVEKKQLESEIESTRQKFAQMEERERKFTSEIERLRTHLLKMEESYTSELVTAEDREKSLRNQVAQLEDSNHAQSELLQQLNTSGEQSKQALATELGTLKYEYSKLEASNNNLNSQLQYQMKCSQNLQNVLEQFKREREQSINEHLRQYQDALREQTTLAQRLTDENNEIRQRLAEYNEALSAARRLNDQIEKKDALIDTLRNENHEKDKRIQHYEFSLRDLQSNSGSRVEKHLVKNILLSYFHTPVDKRQEVIPLLGALVGFSQEEYKKAIDATATNSSASSRAGWLTGWLGANAAEGGAHPARTRTQSETPAYDPNKSFTELLIQYVDQQSIKTPQGLTAKFNTDDYLLRYDTSASANQHSLRKPSISASSNPFVNATNFPLNKQLSSVVLPPSNNQQENGTLNPPSLSLPSSSNPESSSTILKDLLKA